MHPQLAQLKRIALDFLFPQWCLGCGREGELICPSCCRSLPKILPPLCPRCGRPQASGIVCPACTSSQPKIDGICSPFRFELTVRKAIHQLKYSNLRTIAEPLAGLLNSYLAANPMPAEVLVPVPLHRKRERERGYNQSHLLCRELGKLANLPVVAGCLIRERHTPPQARTTTVARRKSNVANAFTCRDHRLKGKQVLLIDDVATSGATLDECATALKASGANSVWGLVLAREV